MKPLLEHITIKPDAGAQLFRRVDDAFRFQWHHHPEYELTLITNSAGQQLVGDSIEPYGPGDLVLLGPLLAHTWHSHATRPGPHEAVVAQFRDNVIGPWPEADAVRRLLRRSASGLGFSGPGIESLHRSFAALPETHGLARITGLLTVLDRLATDTGITVTPLSTASPMESASPLDDRIGRILKRMAEHFTEPMNQACEAERVGLTPAGFARLFRRSVGRRFTQVLHEMRVAEACRRLRDTRDPITTIAFASGFNNLSNFNRVFQRLKGVTPREFRARSTGRR